MLSWPPQVEDVRYDKGIEDTQDDGRLQWALDSAVAFVEQQRAGDFNFTGATPAVGEPVLPAPTPDLVLGTIRLAVRWHARTRSPDGLAELGELGQARIPSTDSDIDRLLGLGRYRTPMVG